MLIGSHTLQVDWYCASLVKSTRNCLQYLLTLAIGVNSYWAQGLKRPHFYDHGACLYDEPPHFCDVILSKLCFSCLHWFYAMLTNRQLDHAVLDILRKGLNLQAPLDIL